MAQRSRIAQAKAGRSLKRKWKTHENEYIAEIDHNLLSHYNGDPAIGSVVAFSNNAIDNQI